MATLHGKLRDIKKRELILGEELRVAQTHLEKVKRVLTVHNLTAEAGIVSGNDRSSALKLSA
jgi:hypothetical protein